MGGSSQAFFLDAGPGRSGQRFCIHHPPVQGVVRAALIYLHPFAEELNKSRRMAALQSRALAKAGCAVLQIDLLGCGDSSGDFGDATWADWVQDAALAARWMRCRHDAPLWLWGLRAGCLLAAQAGSHADGPCNFLFWQPAPSGRLLLQQFLRLKVACDMLDGRAKGAMESLKRQLDEGGAVEVAGYKLRGELAEGLAGSALVPPAPRLSAQRVEWIEVSSGTAPTPASAQALLHWQQGGFDVRSRVVNGPPFWQTSEIEEAPDLLEATVAGVLDAPAS